MVRLYQYNDSQYRLVFSKNDYKVKDNKNNDDIANSGNYITDICSLSRAKRMIREYALCNDFKYFFTSTVDSEKCDRYSLSETQKKIRRIMKTIKAKNHSFKYLFITEQHRDGAFHFHGLCTDLKLYNNTYGYLSSKDFDRLGFNSFSAIISKEKTANYITKYITKHCVKNEARFCLLLLSWPQQSFFL